MALSIGIVGLPNVGKSTVFNALTKAQNAEAANYPFCTIEPNKAIVAVPDPRLDKLSELNKSQKIVYATIEFVDIAGLVKGASKGEGLGNQFLGHIRETAAILHVVRCFDDENVVHVSGAPDPRADAEVINTELILADLQQLEKRLERMAKQAKTDKSLLPLVEVGERLKRHLEEGKPARTFPGHDEDAYQALRADLQPITAKTVLYAANVDENALHEENDYVRQLSALAQEEGAVFLKFCAKFEEDMAGLTDEERHEFLSELGAKETGLEQVIHEGFRALKLISFLTAGPKESRAWTIPIGTTAAKAAGTIHTDFERGFIRAEVIDYEKYIRHGTEAAAKAAGDMRLEGKDYVVRDGDVMHFRFNV